MAEVSGLAVDLQDTPREVHEIAFEDGWILHSSGIGKTDRERDGRSGSKVMTEDRFLRRLRKKARKGLRGWPIATIAFYGPNLSQATKVVVGIMPSENAEVEELRDWKVETFARPRNRPRDTGIYRES